MLFKSWYNLVFFWLLFFGTFFWYFSNFLEIFIKILYFHLEGMCCLKFSVIWYFFGYYFLVLFVLFMGTNFSSYCWYFLVSLPNSHYYNLDIYIIFILLVFENYTVKNLLVLKPIVCFQRILNFVWFK